VIVKGTVDQYVPAA